MTEGARSTRWLRRALALLLLLTLSLAAQTAGAVSYRKAVPQGDVGLSRPTISQQFFLSPGETILRASMWLDGARVEPTWDEAGLVSYTPPASLPPGVHTVRLSVEVEPAEPGYRYDPITSTFSFTVKAGAVEVLPPAGPEELRALERVNGYRALAGLPPMVYQPSLGAAAAAHARYLAANPGQISIDAHGEVSGTGLFTGTNSTMRARYFGYSGGSAEVINFTDRAEEALDGWMDTLYHRLPLLYPGNSEFGYGLAGTTGSNINVVVAGPNEFASGTVLWPVPGQTGVPTGWDGLEEPDPFRLYPGVRGPVGYTITLTFAGTVSGLTLDQWSLRGPAGAVRAMEFSPANDSLLEDTVALIPYERLSPGTTYTVMLAGRVDVGQGAVPYSKSWSFTTATEHAPDVRRMSSRAQGSLLTSVTVEGTGFTREMRVFMGGLPVTGLRVESADRLTFSPPAGLLPGSHDLLLATPGGRELIWHGFVDDPSLRYPAGEPFTQVPFFVHGVAMPAPALVFRDGPVLLPEAGLDALGAKLGWVPEISRSYWTWAGRTGDYTMGRAVGTVAGKPFVMAFPAQQWNGRTYVDRDFLMRLTGDPLWVQDGQIQAGLRDIGTHWAREHIIRLLRDAVVSGTGDGRFQPDGTLTRAAFVKMLTAGTGLPAQPGKSGGFSDTASHWVGAQGYIAAAVQAGIVVVKEYEGGKFLPDQPITREEMAVMVTRALGLDAEAKSRQVPVTGGAVVIGGKRFADAGTWKRPGYVAVAVEQGIITGYAEEGGAFTFRPIRQATRAEAVVMTGRTMDKR